MNPKTWILGLAALFVAFFIFTIQENRSLRIKLDDQEEAVKQLVLDNQVLKEGQMLIANDIQRLDQIAGAKQTIVLRETQLDRDLDEIPETEDRPFADANNLAYAQRLRQHQIDATNSRSSE